MEEKNELNDILLQADEKEGKEKKILFAAIILLFVFFVVLGVMKFTSSESDEGNETVKQELNQTDLNSDANFEQMALDANTSDANISQVLQKIKEGSNETTPPPVTPEPPVGQPAVVAPASTPPVTTSVAKPSPQASASQTPVVKSAEPKVVAKPVTQPAVAPKPQPESKAPVKSAEVKTTPLKKETKEPSPSVVKEPKPKQPSTAPLKVDDLKKAKPTPPLGNVTTGSKAYVQVGNFTGKPKDELLSTIKAQGYTYVLKEVVKEGTTTTKVLVGPFESGKVSENIGKIRSTIKADAFVVRD